MTISVGDALDLLDWKHRIFRLYAQVRDTADSEAAWRTWTGERRELFRGHPQSPIPPEQRDTFEPSYFDYDPRMRVFAEVATAEAESFEIPTSGDETMRFTRIGRCRFDLESGEHSLELYWLDAYGGGLFVPFRDTTSGRDTYGAGRYLLDTVKGADLGTVEGKLVLDFNFSYNPSCAYDPRWVCPLAPPANRLDVAIGAGEKTPGPLVRDRSF